MEEKDSALDILFGIILIVGIAFTAMGFLGILFRDLEIPTWMGIVGSIMMVITIIYSQISRSDEA